MEKVLPERKNIRLLGYDYSQNGAYFVTICTYNRQRLFGEIVDNRMILNDLGRIVQNEWIKSAELRKEIKIDKFIVMPNHFHAITIIDNEVGAYGYTPEKYGYTPEKYGYTPETDDYMPKKHEETNKGTYIHTSLQSPSHTLGAMIRGFKSSVTTKINTIHNHPQNAVWQSKYHDHIIRNEKDYLRICEYIENNPIKWADDCYYEKGT